MATTVCSARPKKETSARLTEATWVAENDAMGEDIARFVQTLYLTRYGAHIAPPRGPFLALRDASGQVRAALALRRGEAPFFLEHYLDAPVHTFLPGGVRDGIVEVGSLAADVPGGARALVVTLTAFLAACRVQWVVFTARRELRNTFARLGIVLHPLAPAHPERLPDGGAGWGSYYEGDPQVVAGEVAQGAGAVREMLAGSGDGLLGLWLRGLALGCGAGMRWKGERACTRH